VVSISSNGDKSARVTFRGDRRFVGDTPNNGSCLDDDDDDGDLAVKVDSTGIARLRSFDCGISSLNDFALSCCFWRGGVPICRLKSSSATNVLGESRPDADCRKNCVIRVGRDGVGAANGENKSVILDSMPGSSVISMSRLLRERFKVSQVALLMSGSDQSAPFVMRRCVVVSQLGAIAASGFNCHSA